jgi:hypothetical protein
MLSPVSQTMKPQTAATKLGIYLPAAPEEFRRSPITRDELDALRDTPPQWLLDVVAAKLGVSRSGLARAGVADALDADEIGALLADPPAWLVRERETHRGVLAERERLRAAEHR